MKIKKNKKIGNEFNLNKPLVDSTFFQKHYSEDNFIVSQVISFIKDFVKRKGKLPTKKDYIRERKSNNLPSIYMIEKCFGSWNNALVRAGFTPRAQGVGSSTKMVERAVRDGVLFYFVYHHLPTTVEWMEFRKKYHTLSRQRIHIWFGGWSNFVEAVKKAANITEDELKQEVWDKMLLTVHRLGFIPKPRELDTLYKEGKVDISTAMIRYTFQSYDSLISEIKEYLKKEILKKFKEFIDNVIDKNNNPSLSAWFKSSHISLKLIHAIFGSWNKFISSYYSTYGKPKKPRKYKKSFDEIQSELLNTLREFVRTNGYIPRASDWKIEQKRNVSLPSFSKISRYFESWDLYLISAGFEVLISVEKFPSTKEAKKAIQQLREVRKKIGKIPTVEEWIRLKSKDKSLIDHKRIISLFGDWESAVNAAGLVELD